MLNQQRTSYLYADDVDGLMKGENVRHCGFVTHNAETPRSSAMLSSSELYDAKMAMEY